MTHPTWCNLPQPHTICEATYGHWTIIRGDSPQPSILFPADEIEVSELEVVAADLERLLRAVE
ncbi:hypothetical protein SAMN06309944_1005 [Micrococcales bacterium KH10]|nr:hypothetical protein SAMN06309944_1005 [Micrococcales bacterium KH10]